MTIWTRAAANDQCCVTVSCTKSENEHTRFFDGLRYHIGNAIDNAKGDVVLAIDTEQSIPSMKNPQRYNFEIDL